MSGSLSGRIDRTVFDAIPRSAGLNSFRPGCSTRDCATPDRRSGRLQRLALFRRGIARRPSRCRKHGGPHPDAAAPGAGVCRAQDLLVVVPVPDKAEQVEAQLCGIAADPSRFRANAVGAGRRAPRNFIKSICGTSGRSPAIGAPTRIGTAPAHVRCRSRCENCQRRAGDRDRTRQPDARRRHERPGDLARLAGLQDAPKWLAPAAEYAEDVRAISSAPVGCWMNPNTLSPARRLFVFANSGFIESCRQHLAARSRRSARPAAASPAPAQYAAKEARYVGGRKGCGMGMADAITRRAAKRCRAANAAANRRSLISCAGPLQT